MDLRQNRAARAALFLIGCIGTRTAITVLAKMAAPAVLQVMGLFALVPAIGFAVIYAKGWRKTGAEVFGDRIWWNDLRPVHAALWASFALLALARIGMAWIILALDTLLGLSAFVLRRVLAV